MIEFYKFCIFGNKMNIFCKKIYVSTLPGKTIKNTTTADSSASVETLVSSFCQKLSNISILFFSNLLENCFSNLLAENLSHPTRFHVSFIIKC